mgnify:CR=1 FL=1
MEDYIKYSAKKLNECGFTGVQSDDLASLPGKNWRRIMASYKALDARGELSIRHYEQCLFERAEDAKAFIEEGYRTGQEGGSLYCRTDEADSGWFPWCKNSGHE